MAEPNSDQIREFVIAGHGNRARVQEMLAEQPALLNRAHPWREDDTETAIQGAAHVGNAEIAEYLLGQGASLALCTAAMLGRTQDVERLLAEDAGRIREVGAHGIPLMAHAVFSGDVVLMQSLYDRGAEDGMSMALNHAVNRGDLVMTRWILNHGNPDLAWTNFQGKTAGQIADERNLNEIAALLAQHAAH